MRTKKVKPDRVVQLAEGMEMGFRFIKGGTFLQGSDNFKSEQPIRKVTVPDFFLGVYPVTNAQYAVFLNEYGETKVKAGPHVGRKFMFKEKGSNGNLGWRIEQNKSKWRPISGYSSHPVIFVTWYGAFTFCNWLSKKSNLQFLLPSESQWEYAARGGNKSNGYSYAGSNRLEEVGWFNGNTHSETMEVGLKFPNELKLFDMSGNVLEWCEDHWHNSYKRGAPLDGSPWLDNRRREAPKVFRGGSCFDGKRLCRITGRYYLNPKYIIHKVGFRVAGI